MNRMIHCESLLEHAAAVHFELSPDVAEFEAQPMELIYYDHNGKAYRYFPDFWVRRTDGSEFFVEVKPYSRLLGMRMRLKLSLVALRFKALGKEYRILTDRELHAEPRFSNYQILARCLNNRSRNGELKRAKRIVQNGRFTTLGELIENLCDVQTAYRLIIAGFIHVDHNQPLSPNSVITHVQQEVS
jgi:hypothetical protein